MDPNLTNARETLADLVLEFLEAAVHEFLSVVVYVRFPHI